MQTIKRVIEYNYKDKFTLYPLGDIHKGVIHCDEDLLERTIMILKGIGSPCGWEWGIMQT